VAIGKKTDIHPCNDEILRKGTMPECIPGKVRGVPETLPECGQKKTFFRNAGLSVHDEKERQGFSIGIVSFSSGTATGLKGLSTNNLYGARRNPALLQRD